MREGRPGPVRLLTAHVHLLMYIAMTCQLLWIYTSKGTRHRAQVCDMSLSTGQAPSRRPSSANAL